MSALSTFLQSGVTGSPSQPGLSQVHCHKWLLKSNGKDPARSQDLRTTVLLRGNSRSSTSPAGCHLPLRTDTKVWCNELAQTGFVSDLSDGCDIETCSSLWGGQQRESKGRALCIDTAPQRHCQFTWTLWKDGKRTMRVLATTFILIAAQCLQAVVSISSAVARTIHCCFILRITKSHLLGL